jgi:hypothetical protein
MPLVIDPECLLQSELATDKGLADHLALIQSLRYIPGAMDRFPKYRVPPVISDTNANCFYLLVSYFETDAWKIASDMVEHICYHGTRPRRTVMGIPSKSGSFLYEAIDVKPIRGKTLSIMGKNNIRGASYSILRDYFNEDSKTTTNTDSISCDTVKEYFDKDIENEYTRRYFETNFPLEDVDELMDKYGPSADPFYGPGGYYEEYPEGLHLLPYPEVLIAKDPEPPVEEEEPTTMSPAMAKQQARIQNEKRRADDSYAQTMHVAARKKAHVAAPSQANILLNDF